MVRNVSGSRASLSRSTRSFYLQKSLLEALENRILLTSISPASQVMYHNDQYSTGDNLAETVLTPANVNSTDFGLVARATLDGQVYAQPLVVPNVNVTRGSSLGVHNVVYAATQNDSLYAIDANTGAILWKDSFLNIANPANLTATAGVTVVPAGGSSSTPTFPYNALVNGADVGPELGIIATPVIDPATNILYLVAYTQEWRNGVTPTSTFTTNSTDIHFVQRLWALRLSDGSVAIAPTTNPPGSAEPTTSGQIIGDTIMDPRASGTTPSFSSYNQTNFDNVSVSSMSQTSGTAKATVANTSGLSIGSPVTVSGASPSGYNGTFTVTAVTSTTFSYSVSSSLSSPATGTIIATWAATTPQITQSNGTATVTIHPANSVSGVRVGDTVIISGASLSGYNGAVQVTAVLSSTSFQYKVPASLSSPASGPIVIKWGANYKYVAGPYVKGTGNNSDALNPDGTVATTDDADSWGFNTTDTTSIFTGTMPSQAGYIAFNALLQMSRTGMTLVNGNLYMGFASHGDDGPYYGWILGYSASTLANTASFVTVPTAESFSAVSGNHSTFDAQAGIWMSGGSIVTDGTYLYMTTGNGAFNINTSNFSPSYTTTDSGHTVQLPIDGDFGDSVIKLAIDTSANQSSLNLTAPPATFNPAGQNLNGYGLKIADFFTSSNALYMNLKDEDLGSGGVVLIPDNITSTVPGHVGDHMLVTGGKEGRIYLIDRDNMGGFNTSYPSPVAANGTPIIGPDPSTYDRVLGEYSVNGVDVQSNQFYSSASYVFDGTNSLFFEALAGKPVWQFNTSTFQAAQSPPNSASINTPINSSSISFPKRGATMSISANGTNNIILWGLNVNLASTDALEAFSENLGTPLYQSTTVSGDSLPGTATAATGVKFSSPTVINGLVYAGTGGNSGSGATVEGTLAIYGLRASYLTSNSSLFSAPSNLTTLRTAAGVQLNWGRNSTSEAETEIDRSPDGTNWSTLTYLASGSNSYIDASTSFPTQYFYRVRAVNGPSVTSYSGTATAPAVLLGDANIDGHVDLSDMAVVLNHFGTATSNWTNGNFDGAATVDLTDLSDVLNNFGASSAISGVVTPDATTTDDTDITGGPSSPTTTTSTAADTTLVSTDVAPTAAPALAATPTVDPAPAADSAPAATPGPAATPAAASTPAPVAPAVKPAGKPAKPVHPGAHRP